MDQKFYYLLKCILISILEQKLKILAIPIFPIFLYGKNIHQLILYTIYFQIDYMIGYWRFNLTNVLCIGQGP